MPRQAFGDVARVQFRAAVDVGAVALDDDRELHDSERGPSRAVVARRAGRFGRRLALPCLRASWTPSLGIVPGLVARPRDRWPGPASAAVAAAPAGAGARRRSALVGRLLVAVRRRDSPIRRPAGGCSGGDRARAILDDAFERARAPLVEVQPAGHRLDPHLQVLDLDAEPRGLEHEVVNQLVVERVERCVVRVVQLRLDVQRLDQRVGLKNSFRIGFSSLRMNAQERPRCVS